MALKGVNSIELEGNIYPINTIAQEIARKLTADKLFDVYRFVDMETHLVHDYNSGKMCESGRKCYELWNRSKPCPNCSSERAVQQRKQVMKMEYLGDKSILILSIPWEKDGKEYVLELGRDVTNSFSVYDATSEDSSELRALISSYSELAARDSFTGLYSKGHANNLLQEIFAVQKEQLKLTLALIDIDHFKNVNDQFGHLCGDEVILYVVEKLNVLNERCSGWAARIGGDEFLLACPFSDREYVEKLCQQMAGEIARHNFKKGGSEYNIEISCGVAAYDGQETLEAFLERVDMKMYEDKAQKK
mgnify:CR=1 FL=1